jgi:acyl carrier protein
MYGITETTVHVSYRPVTAADAAHETRSLIGEPIPDLDIHLLDERQQPVAIGVAGEICVGGAGVASGYLNRPELNAERFIPDPFRGGTARLYRSGDIARRLDDGDIEYLGRRDNQVKIHGFRIELGEIETAAAQHPDLRDCAVIVDSDQRLVCYFTVKAGANPDISVIRNFLREQLPSHMVPQGYLRLDTMPLTVNGKLDRKALPKPNFSQTKTTPLADAANDLERIIAAIWRNVLNADHFGVGENFFDIGGDSVLLAQVHSRLRQELNREISMVDLFEFTTIRSLARHLGKDAPNDREPAAAQQQAQRQRAAFQRFRERRRDSNPA